MKKLLISLILLNVVGYQSVKADAASVKPDTSAMDALNKLQQFVTINTTNNASDSRDSERRTFVINSINDSITKIKQFITNNATNNPQLVKNIPDSITETINDAELKTLLGLKSPLLRLQSNLQASLPTSNTCVATCQEDKDRTWWIPNTHGEIVPATTKDACNAKLYSDKHTCNPISVVWYDETGKAQTICDDSTTNKCTISVPNVMVTQAK